jgi:hypothetical protein
MVQFHHHLSRQDRNRKTLQSKPLVRAISPVQFPECNLFPKLPDYLLKLYTIKRRPSGFAATDREKSLSILIDGSRAVN